MEIINYRLGESYAKSCVVALGFFDGVHLGHRDLLSRAKRLANERGISFGIFTFKSSGKIKSGTKRIYTDKDKADFFEELGADFVAFGDFAELSGLSAEDFISRVLRDGFGVSLAVAGYNYRFGRGAMGNADTLKRLMEEAGGDALICEEFRLDGKPVSTTVIREALLDGNVGEANRLLGSPYRICGRVSHGRGEGKRLGFPTLNTHPGSDILLPRRGVYHTAAKIGGELFSALTNVGTCPTFEERESHLETYLLDFSGNLYDEEISIYFIDYLREEKQFSNEKELITQITVDKNSILEKDIKNLEI